MVKVTMIATTVFVLALSACVTVSPPGPPGGGGTQSPVGTGSPSISGTGSPVAGGTGTPAAGGSGRKVNICHKTGSESNPWEFITVDENAVPAHQAHGDIIDVKSAADCPKTAGTTGTPVAGGAVPTCTPVATGTRPNTPTPAATGSPSPTPNCR